MDGPLQDIFPGRLQAVKEQQSKLYQEKGVLVRFWSKDPSLWPAEESKTGQIRNTLAWIDLSETLGPLFTEISRATESCLKDGLQDWIFVALGSSSLAARALLPLMQLPPPRHFSILDSCHPSSILHLESQMDPSKTGFILANKVGGRLEDHALFLYFQNELRPTSGSNVNQQFSSITQSNSFLASISHQYEFRASFLDPPHILSSYCSQIHFGALLVGLSVSEPDDAISSIRAMRKLCTSPSAKNPALELAIFLSSAALASCRYLVFLTSPSLGPYSNRLGHLIAGSLAREGAGLIPVSGDLSLDTSKLQDRAAFIFLIREEHQDRELLTKLDMMRQEGVPCAGFQISGDEDLLPETFKWEIAVALACASLGFNPFDWPDVRQPRKIAMGLLEELSSNSSVLERSPRLQESGIQVFAEGRTRSEISNLNLTQAMRSFLRLSTTDGFVVLLVFLDRTPEVESSLREIRQILMQRVGIPVLLHFGPRCADQYPFLCRPRLPHGIFLILCGDYPENIGVPGANYTFAQLHSALVLGEFEALVQAEHLVIRLKLGGEVGESLDSLKHILEQASPRT